MNTITYAWKRYWLPRGDNPAIESSEFFPDPDDEFGHFRVPNSRGNISLLRIPCLILLGQAKAVLNQRKKHLSPDYQRALIKRGRIVEPAFGILKANHGFRRWTVRGLDGVKAQWALVCTAHNPKKLYKAWGPRQSALHLIGP